MSPRHRLLIVDDESSLADFLAILFQGEGYDVTTAGSVDEARKCLERASFDLILCDILMPDGNGLDLLRDIKAGGAGGPQVIMMTAYTSTKTAIEAMKLGAFDYVSKPFDVEELKIVAQKALERAELADENIYLRRELEQKYTFNNIIGKSGRMQAIFSLIERIARTTSTVLIHGESGTGKELIARAIHFASPRATRRFVAINCGAMPENLLESELFGHEARRLHRRRARQEGALRGGRRRHPLPRRDRRDVADHAGQAPARPAGEGRPRSAAPRRSRSTCGSSPPPTGTCEARLQTGEFREDLYYRLNVVPIHLPPLRERREDIPLLVEFFLQKYCATMDLPPRQISIEAMHIAGGLRLAGQRARAGERDRARPRPLPQRDDHHPRPPRPPAHQPADQPRPRPAPRGRPRPRSLPGVDPHPVDDPGPRTHRRRPDPGRRDPGDELPLVPVLREEGGDQGGGLSGQAAIDTSRRRV